MQNPTKNQIEKAPIAEADFEALVSDIEKGNDRLFRRLSAEQRAWFLDLIEQVAAGEEAMLEALYAVDYEHIPVPPEVFFLESDYLGHIGKDIYKAWWPHILKICDPTERIYEVDITGAIGLGKSYVINAAVLPYLIYRLSTLRDPQTYFKLAAKSKIVFGIYAITKDHAEEVGFYTLRDQSIDDSPYFRYVFPRVQNEGNELIFGKGIRVIIGSKELHALGQNLFGISLDELNFFNQGKGTAGKAHDLVTAVSRRTESRFQIESGEVAGFIALISSRRMETDYLEKRIKVARKHKGVYVVEGALWDFTEKIEYSGEKFRLQIGDEFHSSKILDRVSYHEEDDSYHVDERGSIETEARVIDVPVEHFKAFDEDPEGAIRDIAGLSTRGYVPFFSNRELITDMISAQIPLAFDAEEIPIHVKNHVQLTEAFNVNRLCQVHLNRYIPTRHPLSPRYVHVDLALTQNMAGISMVHPSGHYITTEEDDKGDAISHDGIPVQTIIKEIEADFVLAVCAGPNGEEIDFQKIRNFIMFLRSVGYWIRKVTYDSWQSVDSIQLLRGAGFDADVQSVDRTIGPYVVLRRAAAERRVKVPVNEVLRLELTGLEHDVELDKVDHREGESKDVADALCASTYACVLDKIKPSDIPPDKRGEPPKSALTKYDKYLSQLREIGR